MSCSLIYVCMCVKHYKLAFLDSREQFAVKVLLLCDTILGIKIGPEKET